jgi:hypothetical protein
MRASVVVRAPCSPIATYITLPTLISPFELCGTKTTACCFSCGGGDGSGGAHVKSGSLDQKPSVSEATGMMTTNNQWECPQCAYVNDLAKSSCEMCSGLRPAGVGGSGSTKPAEHPVADRTNIHGVILGGGAAVAEDLAGDHGGIHLPTTIDEPIPSTSAGNWAGTVR